MNDVKWDWASAATTEILNLHWRRDDSTAVIFGCLQATIYRAICLALMEQRWAMLEPSRN